MKPISLKELQAKRLPKRPKSLPGERHPFRERTQPPIHEPRRAGPDTQLQHYKEQSLRKILCTYGVEGEELTQELLTWELSR